MSTPILVLNGPNLGRLGLREPAIYGSTTYADLVQLCQDAGKEFDRDVEVKQTDHEGEMVQWLHAAADSGAAVILNAGAWTHYSVAVRDAAAQLNGPLIELHITNVHKREEFRHHSVLSDISVAVIAGLGVAGYRLAIEWLAQQ
jgi:3-dehydroquinate dehydratase-2